MTLLPLFPRIALRFSVMWHCNGNRFLSSRSTRVVGCVLLLTELLIRSQKFPCKKNGEPCTDLNELAASKISLNVLFTLINYCLISSYLEKFCRMWFHKIIRVIFSITVFNVSVKLIFLQWKNISSNKRSIGISRSTIPNNLSRLGRHLPTCQTNNVSLSVIHVVWRHYSSSFKFERSHRILGSQFYIQSFRSYGIRQRH